MATKLKAVEPSLTHAGVDTYLSLLSSMGESLKAERAAHKRLMTLARRIEAKDGRAPANAR